MAKKKDDAIAEAAQIAAPVVEAISEPAKVPTKAELESQRDRLKIENYDAVVLQSAYANAHQQVTQQIQQRAQQIQQIEQQIAAIK